MSNPRRSTDEETAPLLDEERQNDSFFGALFHPARKLTNLEKILSGLAILFLILMSTFIGLFAGTKGALSREKGKDHHGGWSTSTVDHTHTATATTTISAIPTGKPTKEVCLTPECILLSADILKSLNTSVDPCDDFYQYAVGGWEASNSIPADRGLYGAFHQVADNNKKIVLKVLDSIPDKQTGGSAEEANLHKLKSLYNSCSDIDKLNKVGLEPLVPLIKTVIDTFGEFDLVPAPDADEEDFVAITSDLGGYVLPPTLFQAGERFQLYKEAKNFGRFASQVKRPAFPSADGLVSSAKVDPERREKLTKILAWLHSRGIGALVNFEIEGDAGGDDPQVQSLWAYQAFGGLPSKEYYEEKPVFELYTSVVKGILLDIASHTGSKDVKPFKRDIIDFIAAEMAETEAAGWPWPWPGDDDKGGKDHPEPGKPPGKDLPLDARMERLATKVAEFERELIRAGADPEKLFNPHYSYNPYSTKAVEKALPFLDLPTYFSAFAIRSFPENITVTHPAYLKAVTNLLAKTPDYVLSGYFALRVAQEYSSALGPKTGVKKEARRLEEVLKGLKKGTEENRQDVCLNYVDEVVGYIAGKEFVKEAFSPEAKKDGETIITNIVDAFYDKLPHISWMDETSAKAAQKKAKGILPKVGYPLTPNTTDSESLARWYARVDIKADDFFGNVLQSTVNDQIRTWSGLGRRRDRQTWEMYPQTVNAYYSPPDGEIVFPAGILQPPFYHQSWPAHLKYGAFGAVAAHELTHAFDNTGSQYDERGRLRQWWTNSTVEAFEERAQCVSKQYSQYYVLDAQGNKVHVNGNLTNGEDIADSGLAQAHLAWRNSLDSTKLKDELRLPGLEYTDEQLFFLAYARVWAQLTRPATAVSRVRTDPHSPPFWRATGTLRNLDAFHQAFQCKEGSKMNPPKKQQCELW